MHPNFLIFTLAIVAGAALAEQQDTPGDEVHQQDHAQALGNLQKLLFDARTSVAKLIAAVDEQEQRILAMQPAGSLHPPVGWTRSRTWAGGSRMQCSNQCS